MLKMIFVLVLSFCTLVDTINGKSYFVSAKYMYKCCILMGFIAYWNFSNKPSIYFDQPMRYVTYQIREKVTISTLCLLVNFVCFLSSADFFQN